jgi:hypothetical protein
MEAELKNTLSRIEAVIDKPKPHICFLAKRGFYKPYKGY